MGVTGLSVGKVSGTRLRAPAPRGVGAAKPHSDTIPTGLSPACERYKFTVSMAPASSEGRTGGREGDREEVLPERLQQGRWVRRVCRLGYPGRRWLPNRRPWLRRSERPGQDTSRGPEESSIKEDS